MNKTGRRIYFDHAATTPVRPEVIEAMLPALTTVYGNPSSFYKEGHEAAHLLATARKDFAEAIHARAEEIYFTGSGTEADNWAIKGVAEAHKSKGKHIISSKIEHHAVLHSVQALAKQGYEITLLDVDSSGMVSPDTLLQALRPDTILVSVMMANNEVGTIQPIAQLASICRERGIVFHSDAVQALGAIPVDVQELQADLISFSAHKLYAPKGVGALYVRKGVRLAPLLEGGAQESRRRAGTENVAGAVAFAKALCLATADLAEQGSRLSQMRDLLIKEVLERIPHAKLNGHHLQRLPNNINFSFEFIEGESILLLLDAQGYACSSGSACTSASLDPSHVLLAMGLPHEIAHGSLRLSLGRENRLEDIEAIVEDLPRIIARLRELSPLWADYQAGRISNALIP